MRKPALTLLAAVGTAVALTAAVAHAQTQPPQIVQASDGSLHLLRDGAQYVLTADPMSDDDLAGYADGGEMSIQALVSAPAPAPAAAPPADAVPREVNPPAPSSLPSLPSRAPAKTSPSSPPPAPAVPGTRR